MRIRTSKDDKAEAWDVDTVIVSASQIKTLSVNYIPKDWSVTGDAPDQGEDGG